VDLGLRDSVCLVTGSTGGIGMAIAAALAKEGANVTVNGRTKERVEEAKAAIAREAPGADVRGIAADLSTAGGVGQLMQSLPQTDILVNNVGVAYQRTFEEVTDDDWDELWQLNVMSGVRLSRAYFGGMLQRNWGRIIFISSESGVNIPAEMIHYGMTKTAKLAIARGMAELTAGTEVTVNSILVGPTRSEGVADFIAGVAKQQGKTAADIERDFFQNVRPSSLLKRFEEPEEIADVVAFICSPLARATNGAAVRADGGVVRSIV